MGAPKDFRTPEAKKWAEHFIPPETCGSIDEIQNALEHLRDANSQLRHVAHLFRTALAEIADGKTPPDKHGHYLAHRAAVEIARCSLRASPAAGSDRAQDEPKTPSVGWRPIESAPRDGTRVLTLQASGHVCENWWRRADTFDGGFWKCTPNSGPTHWMPLPPPPADGEVQS